MSGIKKYDEIREVSDAEATLTPRNSYTYIINAEKYQQTGEIEVKRVLKQDLMPEASVSYVFFRREGCHGYPINASDLSLTNPRGYVGPFQMNNVACNNFLKYMKENHPEMAKNIKGTGTRGYLNLVKDCQDKEKLAKIVEEYALSDFFNGRKGKPEALAEKLAAHLKKTDENGTPDSTRLPLHVIASMPTGVIARGNGVQFSRTIPSLTEEKLTEYCSKWISCRPKSNGDKAYQTLKEVDYLTPEIIAQYQTMNLTGADNLQEKYRAAVAQKEDEKNQYVERHVANYICPLDNLKVPERSLIILNTPLPEQNKLEAKLAQRRLKKTLEDKNKDTENNEQQPSQPTPENQSQTFISLYETRGGRS